MISHRDATPFDLAGPLPGPGTTVLEASAGTGKTHTIASLAARYVAEGTPLESMLLVTFTRMATGELRERVRDRMTAIERGLTLRLDDPSTEPTDDVIADLARGAETAIAGRRERLRRALADFDAATIATTHGFCQEMLRGLGIASDLDPEVTFVEDIDDLVAQVVDDLYLRRFHKEEDEPALKHGQAAEIAKAALTNPAVGIVEADGGVAGMRYRLAMKVREELEIRKRRAGFITYDDLLTQLAGALDGPGGETAAARLQARYSVVLVDEFQDTDPVQWRILERAFGGGAAVLVLIGDPKQAIYAFRGADVYAYLEAARSAERRHTLDVNWRSDQGLIDACDALFGGSQLGHEGIEYRQVKAAVPDADPGLESAPEGAPMRVRVVDREKAPVELTQGGLVRKGSARAHVATDVAADLVALLSSKATVAGEPSTSGGEALRDPIMPGHVAVLVRTNQQAALVRDALEAVGVPAVINGAGSVFETGSAREWLRLLEALERPSARVRVRSAALTAFFGWTAADAAAADEPAWETVHRRLHDGVRILTGRGVAALEEWLSRIERLPERILAQPEGERRLTDLRHVGQLLHRAASDQGLGVTALRAWLRRRIDEAERDTTHEERSRRLESDAEAVQVLTIHRSKGLEFPVVYAPYLWDAQHRRDEATPVLFHDLDSDGSPSALDVSLAGHQYERHQAQGEVEDLGEDLRLAYVALTRARHQAVVWWVAAWDCGRSPLGRLLFARDEDGQVGDLARPSTDERAVEQLEHLAAHAHAQVSVESVGDSGPARSWAPPEREHSDLSAASFERGLDWAWGRTSYSGITADAHSEQRVASEPEQDLLDDEPAEPAPADSELPDDGADIGAVPSLLAEMPVGRELGTLVHRWLEEADFAAPDLAAELGQSLGRVDPAGRAEVGPVDAARSGIEAALESPLGPLFGGARLRDIPRADRLNELEFELPLAGGDEPTGRFSPAAIGELLTRHLPEDDPFVTYSDRLADTSLRSNLRGYLTGSLDLVVRLPSESAEDPPRFAVFDYKTNWLGPPGEKLTTDHYRPAALAAEMTRAHYPLQALLYAVALHRFLRWRLADYDPDLNFAGIGYLFVRGMVGADTPITEQGPCGVFAWRPPGTLLDALSDLFDGIELEAIA